MEKSVGENKAYYTVSTGAPFRPRYSSWPHKQPQTDVEHVEMLFSKSAGKQIERSKNGYKPSKIVQKMFADLFGNTIAIFNN